MHRHLPVLAALVASPFLLVACATGPLSFYKPGVTVAEQRLDEKACGLASADDPDHGQLLAVYRVDRDAVANCMAARGYTVMRGSKVASR
jgi:hypothetical protein